MTTDDRLLSGATSESSLPPNKSSGDIGELKPCPWCGSTASRVRIMSRDAIQCDGENCGVIKRTPDEWNTRTPDPESAAEIERLRREVECHRHMADKNYALWVESQSAVAAAWEEAAKIAERVGNFGDYRREELTPDFGQPRFDMMTDIASAIRAAVSKKTAESGHSPSTHNSESE